MKRVCLLAIAVAACGKPLSDPPSAAPTPTKDSTMRQPLLTWKPTTVATPALEVDVMDGVTADQGVAGPLRYLHAEAGAVAIHLTAGPGQDLTGWRARYVHRAPVFTVEADATVCGRPGRRQEAALGPEQATGAFDGPDGAIGHVEHAVPREVAVALAGTLPDGAPLLAVWTIAAGAREAHRADEDHFFASIRCR